MVYRSTPTMTSETINCLGKALLNIVIPVVFLNAVTPVLFLNAVTPVLIMYQME
jgi:hypothetical protein